MSDSEAIKCVIFLDFHDACGIYQSLKMCNFFSNYKQIFAFEPNCIFFSLKGVLQLAYKFSAHKI